MKKIPYGVANFKHIIDSNMYYVDKTMYLKKIEDKDRNIFFIRPRRFGKSLLLSMMSTYYDINEKNNFEKYFGKFYVGKEENKTEKANKYLILKLNFSSVTSEGGKNGLIRSFDENVVLSIRSFIWRYNKILKIEQLPNEDNTAIGALTYISTKIEDINLMSNSKKLEVMLLIDEYDNFANNLMHGNQELYKEILHGEGYIRTFFKAIKEGTEKGVLTKVFVTGVTPIMLDDVTSGANMFTNASLDENFNSMLGFTEKEVKEIIDYYKLEKIVEIEELKRTLKTYANGYKFSEDTKNTVYNTDMVLYIVKNIFANKKYPRNLIDRNVITDYGKIRNIARNFITEEDMLEIIEKREIGPIILKDRFNLEDMHNGIDVNTNIKSLLFYLGLVTIKEQQEDAVILKIPNYTIDKIYWEYITKVFKISINVGYEELKEAMIKMRQVADLTQIMDIYERALNKLSNRDLAHHTEETSKGIFITLLNTDRLYLIQSEREAKDGYTDLYLREDVLYKEAIKYRYMIEFKHLKMNKLKRDDIQTETKESLIKLNKELIEETIKGAEVQLENYMEDRNIINDSKLILKKMVIITLGRKHVICKVIVKN
ncbi:MAG: AAA family ATPase [Bacillota bacterium]|nr:AAA family ATPase [Bacillota bacterium]